LAILNRKYRPRNSIFPDQLDLNNYSQLVVWPERGPSLEPLTKQLPGNEISPLGIEHLKNDREKRMGRGRGEG